MIRVALVAVALLMAGPAWALDVGLDAYPGAANQFEAGNAAMIPLGAWWIQQSDPSKTGLPPLSEGMSGFEPFLFPTIPGGAAESQYVGGIDVALGISKNTKTPDLACKALTDFIAGAAAQKLINTFNDVPAVTGLNPEKFTSDKRGAQVRQMLSRPGEAWGAESGNDRLVMIKY